MNKMIYGLIDYDFNVTIGTLKEVLVKGNICGSLSEFNRMKGDCLWKDDEVEGKWDSEDFTVIEGASKEEVEAKAKNALFNMLKQ